MIYRNGNLAKFCSYADNGKDFKELFTPALNWIAVSVWCVSSAPLILDDQLCRTQINKTIRKEKIKDSDAFSTEVKHGHKKPVSSFNYALINKSIIYIATQEWQALFDKLSHSKAPKTPQVAGYTHTIKTSGGLFMVLFILAPAPSQQFPFL